MSRFLWTQKEDFGPAPRLAHAMAFDQGRNRTTLFGGDSLNGRLFRDTWEWDGEHWTQMSDVGPSPRRDHSLGHDSKRARTILFGGRATNSDFSDTWEWNGEDWTQITDNGPSARFGHSVTFDAVSNRLVLFGGQGAAGVLGDTWTFDGQDWTQQEDVGPSPRRHHSMAFDVGRSRVVLFGGDSGNDALNDTWEWDGTSWMQVSDFGPDPRFLSAMVFKGDHVALFGGISSAPANRRSELRRDTWEWDGVRWRQRQDIGPQSRCGHSMAFDSPRNRIVLFGGSPTFENLEGAAGQSMGDTWESEDPGVTPVTPAGPTPVEVQSLDLIPNSVRAGAIVTVTITLSAPAPVGGTNVNMAYVPERVVNLGNPVSPVDVTTLPSITIPAGSAGATTKIPTAVLTESVLVFAAVAGTSEVEVSALLSITS